jgi:DNA recombination protein RmuC
LRISKLGRDLYDRIRVLVGHFSELGKGLDRAVESYNKAIGSFEGRVLVAARRFKELGASGGRDIDSLEVIDRATRYLAVEGSDSTPEPVDDSREESQDDDGDARGGNLWQEKSG